MAPTSTKKEDLDIWEDILSSLQSRSNNNKEVKTVLILGSPRSGKSSMLARMMDQREIGNITCDPGLEYSYLDVRDEDKEQVGRIGVYCTSSKHFISHVLTQERLSSMLVILTLSLTEPWDLEDDLLYWSGMLEQCVSELKVDESTMLKLQKKVRDLFSSYQLPTAEKNEDESEAILLPIPEGALTSNVGVPLIIVLNKVDNITTLQKDNDFSEEHFEYIQWKLRKFCLNWGAGLVYCSPRENSNTKLLYSYISHILFGLKFNEEPQVIERDGIFVPIGWDSPSKIGIISEGFIHFKQDRLYADQITRLPDLRQKRTMKGEDDQVFLARMQAVLAEKQKSPTLDRASDPDSISAKTPPPGEGVLANFFNSLLQKKPGSSSSSSPLSTPSPPPPPKQQNLMPPKKALAPQLSAPARDDAPEKKILGATKSVPAQPVAAAEPAAELQIPADPAAAQGSKSPNPPVQRRSSSASRSAKKSGLGAGPVPGQKKRGLPQPKK